jgi:hypothetical protein
VRHEHRVDVPRYDRSAVDPSQMQQPRSKNRVGEDANAG